MNKFSKILEKAETEKKERREQERIRIADTPDVRNTKDSRKKTSEVTTTAIPERVYIEGNKINPRIIAYHDQRSRFSEQYRVLRTNLKSLKRRSLKVIVISSSIEGEGKTVTSLNLAFTLAQDATKKILVIDADMRRSKTGQYLGLKKKQMGLYDVLEKRISVDESICYTPYPNLQILPGNRTKEVPNAAELLDSHEMKKLLELAREEYDYVIIDAPPIIPVTDASVIGVQSDGVLLAVQAERTPRNSVTYAQNLLDQAQVTVLGYVFTSMQYISPGYRDYYYYSYN